MTGLGSRERVLMAINHEVPDRAPMDFGAQPEVWQALLAHFGLGDRDRLLEVLGIDLRYIEPIEIVYDHKRYCGPALGSGPVGAWEDIWGVWRRPICYSHGVYQEIIAASLPADQPLEQVLNRRWPSAGWFDYGDVHDQCRHYGGQYALVGGGWGAVFGDAYRILGLQRFLEGMVTAPDVVREVIRRVECFYLDVNERIFSAADGLLDIYYFGNDLGTQRGLLISPAMIRDFLAPSLKRLIDQAKSHGLKVMFHSCGAVSTVIPMLIELGVDVLDPVQTAAAGMDPAVLKASYGDRIAFHGGLDTQGVLPFGSPSDVRAATETLLATMSRNGGYICGPSQELQPDVPVANILAMYQACRVLG
jgi:uroporphyrinogen decarboxylase